MTRENDGTAIRYYNSIGKRHRTDGPAVTYNNGLREWRLNGHLYVFKDYVDLVFPHDSDEKIMFIMKWS